MVWNFLSPALRFHWLLCWWRLEKTETHWTGICEWLLLKYNTKVPRYYSLNLHCVVQLSSAHFGTRYQFHFSLQIVHIQRRQDSKIIISILHEISWLSGHGKTVWEIQSADDLCCYVFHKWQFSLTHYVPSHFAWNNDWDDSTKYYTQLTDGKTQIRTVMS